jgi:hypothetical protein
MVNEKGLTISFVQVYKFLKKNPIYFPYFIGSEFNIIQKIQPILMKGLQPYLCNRYISFGNSAYLPY